MAPDRAVFDGRVQGLIAPGVEGFFGVLARHAPMVAELTAGSLTVVDADDRRRFFAVSSGFLEVSRDSVTMLADTVEEAGEIDITRARSAEERARRRLQARSPDVDVARAEAALHRALARQEVAAKGRT